MCLYEAVAFLAHYQVFRMRNWSKRGVLIVVVVGEKNEKNTHYICLFNKFILPLHPKTI